MECHFDMRDISFHLFPNLTHLSIWDSGQRYWWETHCAPAVLLPLEELFIWTRTNLDNLSQHLSHDSRICATLRRLTYCDDTITVPDDKWLKCERLTHILVFSSTFHNLPDFVKTNFPRFPKLDYYLVAPTWDWEPNFKVNIPEMPFGGDRRVALVRRHLLHFENSRVPAWYGQSSMWKKLEQGISQNPNVKEVTLIDGL
ncbi:hypothetical protein DL96DRAFT_497134 [Flagelloscypha sp. PMI_526]|nr:hypothetical protein DL96DRAFT_497134 [Flagelloscypha sp. PMI_526]